MPFLATPRAWLNTSVKSIIAIIPKKNSPIVSLCHFLFFPARHPVLLAAHLSRARTSCYPLRQSPPACGLCLSRARFSSPPRVRPLPVLPFSFPSGEASSRGPLPVLHGRPLPALAPLCHRQFPVDTWVFLSPPRGSLRGPRNRAEGPCRKCHRKGIRCPRATATGMRGGDAGARRSLSAEMDVDVAYSAAAGDGGDLELKRFTMEFLSHYCSAIPSVMDDAGKGEPDKKQKRSASKSFLVPCGNGSVKKQCVARCGGLEALKVEELGDNVPFKKQCVTDYGGSETLEELGEGAKVKGKAAIDVVCNPLGKSGGALIQQFMILSFGSLANSTPYLGGILLVIVLAWLGAVKSLDSQFSPLAKQELEREKMMKAKAVETTAQVVGTANGSLQETVPSENSTNGAGIKQSQEPESTTPEKSGQQSQ